MERKKPDIIYSEPVRDIMGSPPASILRYGTTALFVIFIVIIVFAAVFRYPDIVKCPVELTTENPPVTLNSKGSFRIRKLYVNEGDTVKAGDPLIRYDYDFLKENAKSIITPVIISNYEDYADLGKVESGVAEAGKTVVLDIKK